jgi:20S proteasome alpha/beta subunit
MQTAILTAIAGSDADARAKVRVHQANPFPARTRRALACKMAMTLLAAM